jgi:hypothetical protein
MIMKRKSVITRALCCFLAAAVVACMTASPVHALNQAQKAAEDVIGADVTWYDFGDYSSYFISFIDGVGLYTLSVANPGGDDDLSKTALVNARGEVVLAPVASDGYSSSGYGNFFYTRDGEDYIMASSEGVQRIDGAAYSEIGTFLNGYAAVTLKQSLRKGVIDQNANLIFEDKSGKYTDFVFIGDGIFSAKLSENSFQYLDMTGAPLTDTVYTADGWGAYPVSDGRILTSKNGKYGYLNLSGEEIIPFIYDDARSFSGGVAEVCQGEKWGVINPDGDAVIPLEFDHIYPFVNHLTGVSKNEKWGLADQQGTFVFPIEYDQVTVYENGFITVTKEGKTLLTDASGQPLLAGEYSYIYPDDSSQIRVGKTINGLNASAILDANENMLTGWKDFDLNALSERLYLGRKPGDYPPYVAPPHDYSQKFALLDAGGNNLTGFKYDNAGNFFNDYLVVFQNYYDRAGLLNQYGAEVVPTVFDGILLTDEGYAFVTVRDDSDANDYNKTYVGYFKIPDSFSERQNIRPITVYLDGVELFFESDPMMVNERTMVPLRKIFETLGLAVDWDGGAGTIAVSGGGKDAQLTAGSETAYVDGAEVHLDAAPVIQNDVTFVPLRFVSETSGANVEWAAGLRRVIITR